MGNNEECSTESVVLHHHSTEKEINEDVSKIETITEEKTKTNNNKKYKIQKHLKKSKRKHTDIFVFENEITFGMGSLRRTFVRMSLYVGSVFIAISHIHRIKMLCDSFLLLGVVKTGYASPLYSHTFHALLSISLTTPKKRRKKKN